MAVFLSNYSSLAPPRPSTFFSSCSSSSPSNPPKTLPLLSLHRRPPLSKPILGFPPINNPTPSFKFFFTINGKEGFRNDVEVSEGEAGQEHLSDVNMLLEAYKEAVLNGNEKTVSDIEARICIIENAKNELLHKVSALSADITSGKEKYIRLQANFDNFRKRSEKEKLNVRSDAQGEVIESLLLMVDSFESAKQQIKPETEKEQKINTSYQGIYKQFVEIMRSMQVAAVPTVGKHFDPSLHEAIRRERSEEFREGIIIREVRRGFLLGDRLLRPAIVKVSAGPGQKMAPVASQKSAGQPASAGSVDEL